MPGAGQIKLPVAGQAYAEITSSSGNGSTGSALGTASRGDAHATAPRGAGGRAGFPEAATLFLWGVGGVSVLAGYRSRKARADADSLIHP